MRTLCAKQLDMIPAPVFLEILIHVDLDLIELLILIELTRRKARLMLLHRSVDGACTVL